MNKWSIIADHYSLSLTIVLYHLVVVRYIVDHYKDWWTRTFYFAKVFLFQEFDRYDDIRYTCVRNAYKLNVSIHLPKDYITPNITDYIRLKITAKLMKGMNIITTILFVLGFVALQKESLNSDEQQFRQYQHLKPLNIKKYHDIWRWKSWLLLKARRG